MTETLNPYLLCSVKAGTTNGSVGYQFPYSRYEIANSPAAWRWDCPDDSNNKDDQS